MTTQILHIDSSIFGEQGVSSLLNRTLVNQLRAQLGKVDVTHRDLARQPLPHFTVDVLTAIGIPAQERTPAQAELARLADAVIEQVQRADIIVVGAPMYNFGIPSVLKTWLDFIARAGETFRYSETGPEGLLLNKTAYIVTSRGGVYQDQPSDTIVPYLQTFFNFLGITDLRVIYAEGINMGLKEQSIEQAEQAIQQAIQPTVAA